MTNEDIKARITSEFTVKELLTLETKPQTTVGEMSKVDKIILENEIVAYLRDFQENNYTGEKIPQVFDEVLIEWKRKDGLFRFFVKFSEEKEDYVFIDVFHGWNYLGKSIYLNVDRDDYQQDKNIYVKILSPKILDPQYISESITIFCEKAIHLFIMSYIYVEANKDVKDIYEEKTVFVERKNAESENEQNKNRKKKNSMKRDKVFIPRKQRIYTVKRTEITEKNLREYIYSRWKVRGYTYTRRDGKVITVKPHFKNRHLPNKGIEKEGKDYILRKREDDV